VSLHAVPESYKKAEVEEVPDEAFASSDAGTQDDPLDFTANDDPFTFNTEDESARSRGKFYDSNREFRGGLTRSRNIKYS